MNPTILVALIAAAGPIGAYLLAARRMSGKIGTSDAEQLWTESKAIREWSSKRIDLLNEEIQALREALVQVGKRCDQLDVQNKSLQEELTEANAQITKLRGGE